MRLAVVIVFLAAIAVGLVHLRHTRTQMRNEIQTLRSHQITLRRDLWDQQIRLGWLVAPAQIDRRSDELGLQLIEKSKAPGGVAAGNGGDGPWNR